MDILRDMPYVFLGSRLKRFAEQLQADASLLASNVGTAVPPGLYPILALLEDVHGCNVSDLALAMRVSQPAMTKSVNKLREEGLVISRKGDADKRQSIVALTDAGRKAVEQGRKVVWPLIDAVVRDLMEGASGSLIDQILLLENRLAEESLTQRVARFTAVDLMPVEASDVAQVVSLLNRAYRAQGDEAGWTTEAGLINGERISRATLDAEMAAKPDASLLVWKEGAKVIGCVWVEPVDMGVWYLGSLAIEPKSQNAQLGRRLLSAAEQWCRDRGAQAINMTVLEARDTLIAWYERRGYRNTGECEPFPLDDSRFGTPARPGLNFAIMTKRLDPASALATRVS